MKCEECDGKAKYFMYRINEDLSKDWIKVCPKCEERIGDNNMRLQGFNPKNSLPLGGKK